jgi:hypothetical protein
MNEAVLRGDAARAHRASTGPDAGEPGKADGC